MNAEGKEILRASRPEDVFPGDLDRAKEVFRELANRWHPDKPKGDTAVMAKINKLYDEAVEKISTGMWHGKSSLCLMLNTLKEVRFKYLVSRPFELGHAYIGASHISYLVEKKYAPLVVGAEDATQAFRYASPNMEKEMAKYLPRGSKIYLLADGRYLMKVPKGEDLICLRDVLAALGGTMDPKHVAWVGSGMHNIACYLHWAKIVHSNFSLDSVFISPSLHGVALLGGWWYASTEGEKLKYLPTRTYEYLPWEVTRDKQATSLIDLETIRATIRELLGDISGAKLKDPKPLVSWLKSPAEGKPVEVYAGWQEVLKETFGKRRFIELKLTAKEVYQGDNNG
jgi:hypothetical protein